MLRRVKCQDWNAQFAYAPPVVDAVVNTDHIVSAVPTDSRGSGPWTKVSFVDGRTLTCQGTPETFLGADVLSEAFPIWKKEVAGADDRQ
jgi:hypothetical protein